MQPIVFESRRLPRHVTVHLRADWPPDAFICWGDSVWIGASSSRGKNLLRARLALRACGRSARVSRRRDAKLLTDE